MVFFFSLPPPGNSVLNHGLPPAMFLGSQSSSISTSDHESAQLFEKELGNIEHDGTLLDSSFNLTIWNKHNNVMRKRLGELECASVTDLCSYVKIVLEDITEEAGLNLSCLQQKSLFGKYKPDLWVVCLFGVPVGVIEVKKPTGSPLDDESVFGQMYDYLSQLNQYIGRSHAFGILTTYNEWRIVWLPDSNDVAAQSTTVNEDGIDKLVQGPKEFLPSDIPDWDEEITSFETLIDQSQPQERRLIFGTAVMKWNDIELPQYLLSVLYKMASSPTHPISITALQCNRSYIHLKKAKWGWGRVAKEENVSFGAQVPKNFQTAYLFADLGGGGDGWVWLACTPKGNACVLKFSDDKESLDKEAAIWNEVWKCEVLVKILNNRSVLVMPWLKHCTEDDYANDPNIRSAVNEAVEKFANAGYLHDDIHYRHIGLFRKNSRLQALLFDLARVSHTESSEDAISEMMQKLTIDNDQ